MDPSLVLRKRSLADRSELAAMLAEQQPAGRYPIVWPLPMPVEDFIVRHDAESTSGAGCS